MNLLHSLKALLGGLLSLLRVVRVVDGGLQTASDIVGVLVTLRLASLLEVAGVENLLRSVAWRRRCWASRIYLAAVLLRLLRGVGVVDVSLVATGNLSVCRHDDGLGSWLIVEKLEVLVKQLLELMSCWWWEIMGKPLVLIHLWTLLGRLL
jgi:hypothetical protein